MVAPIPYNHIGIGVPDIDAAVAWYRDVLGCTVLKEPELETDDGSHFGNLLKDLYGARFHSVRMAHVTTVDGLGLEFFEFVEPATEVPENTYEYWRSGIFHLALTTPDIDAARDRIASSGGTVLSQTWTLFANKPFQVVYCQDPWGTVIELCTHAYSQFWSNHEPPQPMPQ